MLESITLLTDIPSVERNVISAYLRVVSRGWEIGTAIFSVCLSLFVVVLGGGRLRLSTCVQASDIFLLLLIWYAGRLWSVCG